MLNFVDITKERPYQGKNGIPLIDFGIDIALSTTPLDFQYSASEAISSFSAVKVDYKGAIIETIPLSPLLITYDSIDQSHTCTGLVDYTTDLECGYYYYFVNSRYRSDYFKVLTGLVEADFNKDSIISISGLDFIDLNYEIEDYNKQGASLLPFAPEYGTNFTPLAFQYKSSEAISSFKMVKVDILGNYISEESLNTSLVVSSGGVHTCTGVVDYDSIIKSGCYYFVVNDRYKSKVFGIFELLCFIAENIVIGNAIAADTSTLDFDSYLIGSNFGLEVELTYTFSKGITSFSETVVLLPTTKSFSTTFAIPSGLSGICQISISSNVCDKVYTSLFNITGLGCLELFGGGNLELFNTECLELF